MKSQNIHNYKNEVKQKVDEIKDTVDGISFINKDNKNEFTEDIIELINNFSEELQTTIDKKIHTLITDEQESLYLELINIIEDRIGELYSQEWIDSIEQEGKERFEKSIPPGFNDKGKDNSKLNGEDIRRYGEISYRRKYGDLIIWKDILKYATGNENGRKVIFVTDDGQSEKKNDLLYKVKGMTLGPHIHLMNELNVECKKELYILKNLRFIQLVNNLSDEQVNNLKTSFITEGDNNTYSKELMKLRNLEKIIAMADQVPSPIESNTNESHTLDVGDIEKLNRILSVYNEDNEVYRELIKMRNRLVHSDNEQIINRAKKNYEELFLERLAKDFKTDLKTTEYNKIDFKDLNDDNNNLLS
ncbi:hypothetical protein DOK76_06315 [Vagococcus sp. DIV0080]|uniref:PIN like domain-containing protein n=1 Tax=Candidatus Vagococcus giribetii TaxID=2230876 RepID=A0ABS3HSE3_9ENTE|nr:hypothetical protein [Vagococcus sp. DIV0080]